MLLFYPRMLLYVGSSGRGMPVDEDDSLWDFNSSLRAFISGIIIFAVGILLMRLYNTKFYDREWIKNVSFGLMVFGSIALLPLFTFLWYSYCYIFCGFVSAGYIVYLYILHKHKEIKCNGSVGNYLNILVGVFILLYEKMKWLYKWISADDD